MTTPNNTPTAKKYPEWAEFIPLLLFLIANKYYNIYVATGVLIASSVINLALTYFINKKVSYASLVSVVLVAIFGGITIFLHNDSFIKIKVTIMYVLLATILSVGLLLKRNFLQLMLNSHFNITAKGWKILTISWIVFFLCLAIINEIIWRNFSTNFWINFKVFGIMAIIIVFTAIIIPIVAKHKQ